MAWGCNRWFQQGVYLTKNFSDYYRSDEQRAQPQEGDNDLAYSQLAVIANQTDAGNDHVLMF